MPMQSGDWSPGRQAALAVEIVAAVADTDPTDWIMPDAALPRNDLRSLPFSGAVIESSDVAVYLDGAPMERTKAFAALVVINKKPKMNRYSIWRAACLREDAQLFRAETAARRCFTINKDGIAIGFDATFRVLIRIVGDDLRRLVWIYYLDVCAQRRAA